MSFFFPFYQKKKKLFLINFQKVVIIETVSGHNNCYNRK
jgi:hypothetical protein